MFYNNKIEIDRQESDYHTMQSDAWFMELNHIFNVLDAKSSIEVALTVDFMDTISGSMIAELPSQIGLLTEVDYSTIRILKGSDFNFYIELIDKSNICATLISNKEGFTLLLDNETITIGKSTNLDQSVNYLISGLYLHNADSFVPQRSLITIKS